MFASSAQSVNDNHTSAANIFATGIRQQLPHPLNMVAHRKKGSQAYEPRLPDFASAAPFDLQKPIAGSRSNAQGMLLQYLKGSAKFYVDHAKEDLPFKVFNTKVAKDALYKRLRDQVGFLHCAFRYRGKANYRDAIYLTYGSKIPHGSIAFLDNLCAVSRFVFVLASAYVQRRVGTKSTAEFSKDLSANLRGVANGPQSLLFWKDLF